MVVATLRPPYLCHERRSVKHPVHYHDVSCVFFCNGCHCTIASDCTTAHQRLADPQLCDTFCQLCRPTLHPVLPPVPRSSDHLHLARKDGLKTEKRARKRVTSSDG